MVGGLEGGREWDIPAFTMQKAVKDLKSFSARGTVPNDLT
jgi:hypothetical protein